MKYLDLSKRVPEPEEEMEGAKEAKSYFIISSSRKGGGSYQVVAIDIFRRTKLNSGRILDVGCAYGGLIKQINLHTPGCFNFVGVDLSKSMLKLAKNYCRGIKVAFSLQSADKTSFADESFDLVVCKDTFHHFKSPVKVLKEMYRLVKKGGYIYLIDLNRNAPEEVILQTIQTLTERDLFHAMQYFDSIKAAYTIAEMRQLFKKAGMRKYSISKPHIDKDFLKIYKIPSELALIYKNFMKGRWVAVIKK